MTVSKPKFGGERYYRITLRAMRWMMETLTANQKTKKHNLQEVISTSLAFRTRPTS